MAYCLDGSVEPFLFLFLLLLLFLFFLPGLSMQLRACTKGSTTELQLLPCSARHFRSCSFKPFPLQALEWPPLSHGVMSDTFAA